MGKRVIIFFIVLINLGLCLNTAQSQVNFLGSYGGYWTESFPELLESYDGSLILNGSSQSFPHNDVWNAPSNYYILKVDTNGTVIWDITNTPPSYTNFCYGGLKTFDGNYLFLSPTSGTNILKTNDNGDTIFFHSVPEGPGYVNYPFGMCITADSNYIVSGQWSQNGRQLPYLQKITGNADLIWDSWYDFENDSSEGSIGKIILTSDNGFMSVGNLDGYYPFIIHYDGAGNVEWWKYYREFWNDPGVNFNAINMQTAANGNIWLVGEGVNSSSPHDICANNPQFSYLLEINLLGEVLNTKFYCYDEAANTNFKFDNIKITDDGGCIIWGTNNILPTTWVIQKLNADWEEEWTVVTEYDINDVIQHSSGTYYATGEILYGPPNEPRYNTDFFLLKIAANGTAVEEFKPQKEVLNIYPNPAYRQLTIQATTTSKAEYFIYDASGRLLQTGGFVQSKTIDLGGLAEGVYLIRVETEDGVVSRKFVKQKE
jgi:hypothetical protein